MDIKTTIVAEDPGIGGVYQRHEFIFIVIECSDGEKLWYLDGVPITLDNLIKELKMTEEEAVLFKLTWA